MAELTKQDLEQLLDKRLQSTEDRIIKRIDEAQEELARLIADTVATPFTQRFEHLESQLDVKNDVAVLKQQVAELRATLHLGV